MSDCRGRNRMESGWVPRTQGGKSEARCGVTPELAHAGLPTRILPSSTQQILSRKQENSLRANSFSLASLLFVE
ncbi:Hypothetical predicted protein, partial [Marmota monax]